MGFDCCPTRNTETDSYTIFFSISGSSGTCSDLLRNNLDFKVHLFSISLGGLRVLEWAERDGGDGGDMWGRRGGVDMRSANGAKLRRVILTRSVIAFLFPTTSNRISSSPLRRRRRRRRRRSSSIATWPPRTAKIDSPRRVFFCLLVFTPERPLSVFVSAFLIGYPPPKKNQTSISSKETHTRKWPFLKPPRS